MNRYASAEKIYELGVNVKKANQHGERFQTQVRGDEDEEVDLKSRMRLYSANKRTNVFATYESYQSEVSDSEDNLITEENVANAFSPKLHFYSKKTSKQTLQKNRSISPSDLSN